VRFRRNEREANLVNGGWGLSIMKRAYLGDSYDAVKRLWQQALQGWAPLFAEPRYLPIDIRSEFTRLTGIPMLADRPPTPYAILNDPDTGIRFPKGKNQREGRRHIALLTIANQVHSPGVRAVLTFDMSIHRNGGLKREQQRHAKMRFLFDHGVWSFYYVSHAPFLFAFRDDRARQQLRTRLQKFGIPADRIQS
jgi:hypothetical protein